MRNATIRQLQIFSVAASHLSFARAAEKLHLTHAAISLQIKQLEEVSGTLLFERIGKRVFLTEAGEILLSHARQILQSLKEADEALLALKGLKGGRISVAVASTAEYFAPGLLAEFRKTQADVRIRMLIDNRDTVSRLLTGNEYGDDDAAIDGLLGELEEFYSEVEIPCWLSSLNISIELLGDLVRDSRGSSMSGNPRQLADDELVQLLEANW